jgi:hypothetical protein
MPTRPKDSPQYAHDTGTIGGLEPWGWEDYGAGGDWWEGTGTDPSSVPGEIQGEWGDYSLGYGPEGTGPGLGPESMLPFNWEDRETALAGTEGGLGSLFGEGSDYKLDFDPTLTANRSWRPTYGVTGPEGVDTGYHIGAETPYGGYPWVPGGYEMEWDDGNGNGNGKTIIDDRDTTVNTDPNIFPLTDPTTPPLDPAEGLIQDPAQTIDYPYTPPEMHTIGVTNWGDDPISQRVNAGLGRMAETGGIVPTDLALQTERALRQIQSAGGGGGAAETPFGGEYIQQDLEDLIKSQGVLPRDTQLQAMEFEQARTPIDAMRKAQMAQGQAAMASRNILGQGPEVEFMEGLESRLAPEYASAGQQLAMAQMDRADERYQNALTQGGDMAQAQAQRREDRLSGALQISADMSDQQARNMLSTAQTWTDRQQMLNDTAIAGLDRDMEWSKFLANYGLEREQFIDMVQNNRLAQLLPLLQAHLDSIKTTTVGQIPYDIFD